jgi:hypothetical protein
MSAAAARKLDRGVGRLADVRSVQVAEAVDLGPADEAEIDGSLSQERHHVAHAGRPDGADDVGRVAHGGEKGLRRPVPHQPQLEEPPGCRSVGAASHAVSENRQPHADEDQLAVPDLPGRHRDHQL